MSLPCLSISKTMDFYVDVIGADLGRHSTRWLDIDSSATRLHLPGRANSIFPTDPISFEETVLPSFHFGVIVDRALWETLYQKMMVSEYEGDPTEATFLKDQVGEHVSFFCKRSKWAYAQIQEFSQDQGYVSSIKHY